MEPTATEPSDDTPPVTSEVEVAAIPPFADLLSREIRRMGRAWKIEATKSAVYVVATIMAMTVLGIGWLILLSVVGLGGCYLWSKFSVSATLRPYRLPKRNQDKDPGNDGGNPPPVDPGEQYHQWLVGSAIADEAGLADIREPR